MTAPVREFDSTKKLPTDLMNTPIDFPTLSSSLFNEQLAASSIPHEWLLSGDPRTRSKLLGRTPDRLAYAMLWECGAVSYKWNYSRDEAYIVLSGEGFMTDDKGIEHRYGAGDVAFFPAGTKSVWRHPDHFRKIAVLKDPAPGGLIVLLKLWNKLSALMRPADKERE
jgi:uncharacterized protein